MAKEWYKNRVLRTTARILVIAGGITWLTQTWFDFNIISMIAMKTKTWVGTLLYNVVGISAVYEAVAWIMD